MLASLPVFWDSGWTCLFSIDIASIQSKSCIMLAIKTDNTHSAQIQLSCLTKNFCSKALPPPPQQQNYRIWLLREQYLSSVSCLNSKQMYSKACHLDREWELSNHLQEMRRLLQSPICNTDMKIILSLTRILQCRMFMWCFQHICVCAKQRVCCCCCYTVFVSASIMPT